MTMIGFAAYDDHAEIITDTASYTLNGAALASCTKFITLPHIDAAVVTQGNSRFGIEAKSVVLQASGQHATFDQLVADTPTQMRFAWSELAKAGQAPNSEATVFLLGYSTAVKRFMAYGFASDHKDFEPFAISGTWLMPMPWGHKPSSLEMARFARFQRDHLATATDVPADAPAREAELRRQWAAKPSLPPLHGVDDWTGAALTVRRSRALQGYGNVYVAGKVMHTRLGRGLVQTATIHEFDDSGEEFLQMISGTQHPIAQLMACWCESGKTFLTCHLADQADQPCGCRSGRTFAECCMVSSLDAAHP